MSTSSASTATTIDVDLGIESGNFAETVRLRRNWVVIVGIAIAAMTVLALQAFLHSHFSAVDEYDDGVYFGASIELLHGIMPYRDFAFIQPPMITVWMLPFAALSPLTGTAVAMEAGRFFVDLVTVANVVLVGALVRRRSTLQVTVATGVMAFSQGTIRSSQTILLEPFVVLACLIAFLCLMEGERVTTSPRRILMCGVFLGVGGATKVWAVLPLAGALIVLSPSGLRALRRLIGGAVIGFTLCSLPFIIAAPFAFFRQVVVTQAIRNGGGLPLPERLADLTGIPGLSSLITNHRGLGTFMLAPVLLIGIGIVLVCWTDRERRTWSPLELLAIWGTLFVGVSLLLSPTYYYHYSGFMAPFIALVASSLVARLRVPICRIFSVRSFFFPTLLAWFAMPLIIAVMLGAIIVEVVDLPVAPQVGDAVSDAIPRHGCVLYANQTLALLDNRFTSDVSGCPNVIDWLGQERVLDDGYSASLSDIRNRGLQKVMGRWIDSSEAVVLERSDFGLDDSNMSYLHAHFKREADLPRGLRIYMRAFGHRHSVVSSDDL